MGVRGGWLILRARPHRGAGRGDAIAYNGMVRAVDETAMWPGRPGRRVFRARDVVEHVHPPLPRATEIPQGRKQLRMLHGRPWLAPVPGTAIAATLAWPGFGGSPC